MDSLAAVIWCPIVLGVIALLAVVVWWQYRRYKAINKRMNEVRQQEQSLALFNPIDLTTETPFAFFNHWAMRYRIEMINGTQGVSGGGLFSVSEKRMALFERSPKMPEVLAFRPEDARWYGRPVKYGPNQNEIWLHIEKDAYWIVLKLWLYQEPMRDLVRLLKRVTAPELTIAYRRQRPYIHRGPVKAHPATQGIHGEWTLDDAISLYLMPRFLVMLNGDSVLRKIPLEIVQEIGALKRVDQPSAAGLIRFRAEGELFAFALPNYEAFAQALAEAAKRTLEIPLVQKQKGKKEEDDDE